MEKMNFVMVLVLVTLTMNGCGKDNTPDIHSEEVLRLVKNVCRDNWVKPIVMQKLFKEETGMTFEQAMSLGNLGYMSPDEFWTKLEEKDAAGTLENQPDMYKLYDETRSKAFMVDLEVVNIMADSIDSDLQKASAHADLVLYGKSYDIYYEAQHSPTEGMVVSVMWAN